MRLYCLYNRQVFKIYFKDGSGGWFLPVVLIIISVLTQVVSNLFDWWLSYWSDKFLEDGAVREESLLRFRPPFSLVFQVER